MDDRKNYKKMALMAIMFSMMGYASFGQGKVTVEEAIRVTLERNLQVKQATLNKDLAAQDVFQAKSNLYPDLGISVNQRYNNGFAFDQVAGKVLTGNDWTTTSSGSLSSNVTIFQGLQKVNQIKANKLLLESAATQIEKIKYDLMLSVLVNYLEAITNKEMTIASEQQILLSKEQVKNDSIQFEVGNKTLADLSQSKNQVATDQLNLVNAKNAYESSLLALKQLMELSPQTDLQLVKPQVEAIDQVLEQYTAETVFDKAKSFNPELKKAQLDKQAALKQIAIAKGGYLPTLSLGVSYGSNYSSKAYDLVTQTVIPFGDQVNKNKSFGAGLSLSIPIFDNNKNKVNVSKAKINLQLAETNEQLLETTLNKTVNQAVLDLSAAAQRYQSSLAAFSSATDAFQVIKERYDIGMANGIELFTAQTNRNKAEFDLIQAKYNMIFKDKIIDYYVGNPIKFDVN
ncbi:TolC family protein [Sphingobacterium sp. SG20118]|uniref:TolC family protein n=1 Tax=Sphingobacterium TaxID=28453 RepID=UPI0004F6E27C|nr:MULTISPECIES: TolC family protein [Sphingobacterium]AIM36549.1 transporter [Sphingobacterium sp. ML3W]MDH5827274.1 TolC family protein [Sphingobacterium faecium]